MLPTPNFNMGFLFYFLWSRYQQIRAMARGANQPNLNLALVKSIEVPVPPIDVQNRVSDLLDATAQGGPDIEARVRAAEKLFQCVLRSTVAHA
jgi:type I restriction enzyme S subunit